MTSLPIGYRLGIHSGPDLTPQTETERHRIADAAAKFGTPDWDGNPVRIPGTRVPTPSAPQHGARVHQCGGQFSAGRVVCPGCRTDLFPMFRLAMDDPQVAEVVNWPLPTLELPVCPGCILFHCDYSVDFSRTPFELLSSEITPGMAPEEIEIEIATPYESRDVTLRRLEPHEYPDSEELCDYEGHQIGGIPPRWYSKYAANDCPRCMQKMQYTAVVHYDAENVPLFEQFTRKIDRTRSEVIQAPTAFSLGDLKSYYVFSCSECLVLTYRFAM